MAQKINHVIVALSNWQVDGIKYRRNRLAEFLSKQSDTENIFWVYPVIIEPMKPIWSTFQAFKQLRQGCIKHNSKMLLCGLPDLLPGNCQSKIQALQGISLAKLKKEIKECQDKKVLWFTCPWFPFLAKLMNWDKIIYDCSDLWGAFRGNKTSLHKRVSWRLQATAELNIINSSDLIYATSDYLAQHVGEKTNRQVRIIENGVDFEMFQSNIGIDTDILRDIPRPRFGFVGGMKPKINFSLLSRLADNNKDYSIVLIGPKPKSKDKEFEDVLIRKNVYWLGEVEPEKVPNYMRCLDVGLLPYKEIEYNKAVFPLKLYEYLAVGLPVVGCGLPSTEKYKAEGIYLHVKEENYIKACKTTVSWGKFNDIIDKRVQIAEKANWECKFKEIYEVIYDLLNYSCR